jgi:hypothetical protein
MVLNKQELDHNLLLDNLMLIQEIETVQFMLLSFNPLFNNHPEVSEPHGKLGSSSVV